MMPNSGIPEPIEKFRKILVNTFTKLSKIFDRIVYSKKSSVIVSLVAAIMFCITVNYEEISFEFFNREDATLNVPGVKIEVKIDSDVYQVNGMPQTVDLTLTGSPADIQTFRNNNTAVVEADLRKFKEGENVVSLNVKNVPSKLKVEVTPPNVTVKIEQKKTKSFLIRPEFLLGAGQKLDDFEIVNISAETVTVKATQEKLNAIRKVSAIVDATGRISDFETGAVLVAYDGSGNKLDVQIEPIKVMVKVVKKDNKKEVD